MASLYTTNTLIDSIKRRASIPENQSTFQEEDFLAFINEELSLNMVPMIMSLHEDYFLFQQDDALVANQADYPIPSRAVGNKLREIQYVDSNDNVFEMTRIGVGDIPDFQGAFTQNHAYTFYLKNNNVVLIPKPTSSVVGSLRFYYYIRPSELVPESRVGIINDINTVTNTITVSNSTFPTNFVLTETYDLYKAGSPHSQLSIDITASAIDSSTKTITFSELPTQLAVGDHVALSCESIIPQVPSDLHVLLAQYVAERILESIGDAQGLAVAKSKTAQMEVRSGTVIDSRVDDAPIKLVNRNGVLRSGLSSKRYKRRN